MKNLLDILDEIDLTFSCFDFLMSKTTVTPNLYLVIQYQIDIVKEKSGFQLKRGMNLTLDAVCDKMKICMTSKQA